MNEWISKKADSIKKQLVIRKTSLQRLTDSYNIVRDPTKI